MCVDAEQIWMCFGILEKTSSSPLLACCISGDGRLLGTLLVGDLAKETVGHFVTG